MINSSDIDDLRADVRANVETLLDLCDRQGLKVKITQTLRDDEYQAMLYEQGRTTPGEIVTNAKRTDFHGAGLAFDICQNIKGLEYSDISFFENVAVIAKAIGFSWGGDWTSFLDRPHFQWDENGVYTGSMILSGKLPPDMPKWEGNMSYDTFKAYMDQYLQELSEESGSTWSEEARTWATENGLIQGDEKGNQKWKGYVDREQLAVVLQRYDQSKPEKN